MPRHVLVTGGAGFIGSHLVDVLAATGYRISVVDDLSRGRRAWLQPDAELFEADVRNADAVADIVRRTRPDAVVHLAALHFIPAVDGAPELAWAVNVEATRTLVDALAVHPPELAVFASSAAVYPDTRGPITESCPAAPVDLYGRTKLEGERVLASLTETRLRVARIFNVVGRRETNPHVVPDLVGQVRAGANRVRLGNLETRRDYVDVRDVADALGRLVATSADGETVYNVGTGASVSVAELVELCSEIAGRPLGVDVDEQRLRPHDRAELCADSSLLRSTTGWRPRHPLRETLAELIAEAP